MIISEDIPSFGSLYLCNLVKTVTDNKYNTVTNSYRDNTIQAPIVTETIQYRHQQLLR